MPIIIVLYEHLKLEKPLYLCLLGPNYSKGLWLSDPEKMMKVAHFHNNINKQQWIRENAKGRFCILSD